MAGKVLLAGGPNPAFIHDGSVEEIICESVKYIEGLGANGGYSLGVGGGMMPGTPPEKIAAMVEASKRVGWPLDK